jgi:hypothetical protein
LVFIYITRLAWARRALRGRRGGLEPAALGRDQDGLGAIDGAELAVDVVQVRPDGARRVALPCS